MEIACRTDSTQVLTTLVWAGRMDAVSRRLLMDALRAAAHPGKPARLPVFAAAARDLFRHAVHTLPTNPGRRARRHRAASPARHRPSHAFAPEPSIEAPSLPADILAAIDDLRTDTRLQPRVTLTDNAAIDRLTRATLPALHGLFVALGTYLEHALQPHVSRAAVRAFILETRRELDDLAPCPTTAGVYLETLTLTEPGDNTVTLEIDAALGAAGP